MKRASIIAAGALVLAVIAVSLAGCDGTATSTSATETTVAPSTNSSQTPTTSGTSTPSTGVPTTVEINPADFSSTIDNQYMPLKPGTTWVFEGTKDEEPVRVEVSVTPETKTIMGVPCVVVSDQVFVSGELEEATLDWYAQDNKGNVWYFGEDSKEYANGKVSSTAGSWEGGVNGAQPGVIMEADPKVGDTYQQEYLQGEAEDMAQVLAVGVSAQVSGMTYQDVLRTRSGHRSRQEWWRRVLRP